MTRVVAVVPGRMESTRFPGKMLVAETGTPLIVHCALNAAEARRVDSICIASDSAAIAQAAAQAGIGHVMTHSDHPNGTSRIAEVAQSLEADLIVNVQGDEPELAPAAIDATIDALLADTEASVGTAAAAMSEPRDMMNPSVVKVVLGADHRALYFSRAAIGQDRDGDSVGGALRHVGLYVYTPEALREYVSLPQGPLELNERLEQLRLVEHGRPITVARVDAAHSGIDTPEQYAAWLARREG